MASFDQTRRVNKLKQNMVYAVPAYRAFTVPPPPPEPPPLPKLIRSIYLKWIGYFPQNIASNSTISSWVGYFPQNITSNSTTSSWVGYFLQNTIIDSNTSNWILYSDLI